MDDGKAGWLAGILIDYSTSDLNPKFMDKKFISVVIPSYNEEKYVANCLSSILECRYPHDKLEIILVDNGSTDNTLNIAKRFDVTILVDKHKTIGGLRNLGVQHARGNILAFLDADCTVSPLWLYNAGKILENKDIGITGSRLNSSGLDSWVERSWILYLQSKQQKDGFVKYINSGNCFVRREVFEAVGGFSEILTTNEDVDLCEKISNLGYSIYHCKKIVAVHWGYPKTIRQFFKRELWHGIGDVRRNIAVFWRSKSLLISLYNLILISLIIPFSFTFNPVLVLCCITLFFLLPPVLLTVLTMTKIKTYKGFPGFIAIFCVYGFARTCSIFLVIRQNLKKGM